MAGDINDVLLGEKPLQIPQMESASKNAPIEVDTAFLYEAYTEDNIVDANFDMNPELITLLGLDEYGKSTFVGSFYHLLRTRESFCGFSLIDTDTIAGFERRLYLRTLNDEGKSEVKRTRRKKGSLLNLRLIDSDNNPRHILLSDGAGETYRECLSKDSIVMEQIAVKAANRLLIFVNCEEFNDVTKPWKEDLKALLKRFDDNSMLPENATVYVVLNKFDKASEISPETIESYINEVKSIIEKHLAIEDNSIFKVNSKGLFADNIDEGLTNLISEILKPVQVNRSLYKDLDWISNAIKDNK